MVQGLEDDLGVVARLKIDDDDLQMMGQDLSQRRQIPGRCAGSAVTPAQWLA